MSLITTELSVASGESRSSKELLKKKSQRTPSGHPLVINRDSSTSALEEPEEASRTPTSQATGLVGLARWVAAAGVRPGAPGPPCLLTDCLIPNSPAGAASLRDRQDVLAVGVPAEARGVERVPVEDPVQHLFAAVAVLVSQQGVHEGVGRGLAVGQALGQHAPVGADGHRGGQLHQPVERRDGRY